LQFDGAPAAVLPVRMLLAPRMDSLIPAVVLMPPPWPAVGVLLPAIVEN